MDITRYYMHPHIWDAIAEFIFQGSPWIERKSVDNYLAKKYELHHTTGFYYESTDPEKLIEFVLRWS